MNVEELLERFDEIIDKAWSVGKRSVVHSEELKVVIDDIRLNMPAEIKQARGIVSERVDIINTAKKEAEDIIKSAEEKARAMVAQEEITKMAQQKASEILASAQQKNREMKAAVQDFVDDLMKRADEDLTSNLAEVRKTRASLRQQRPQMQAEQ